MNIQFELNDQELNNEKKELISRTLNIDPNIIEEKLSKIAKAATIEYISMLIEGGMPNRADETKQDRLFNLITHYFEHSLPTESQISTIFQLTQSQSKTLLKNTLSRFRNKLTYSLRATMINVIESAEQANDKYLVIINSEIVKDELNMLITQNEPTFKPITKRKDSGRQYEISEDSYLLLRRVLSLDNDEQN